MAKQYLQGKYTPKNPKKYRGDPTQVTYRSSWERKIMKWLDDHPTCIQWSSEEIVIPYYSPIDDKPHRYFVDFFAEFKTKEGSKKFLIEVKPDSQTRFPEKGNKKQKTFLTEAMTYAVNDAKWKAAKKFAQERGMEFIIITEKELGIGKR